MTLWYFQHFGRKTSTKLKGYPLKSFKFEKKSHNAAKTGKVDPLENFNIHSVGKRQKIEVGLLVELKRSPTMSKKNGRGPLVSPGIVCYAKKRKTFFSSVRWAKWFNLTT